MTRTFVVAAIVWAAVLGYGTAAVGDDSYLQICLAAAADGSPVYPTENVPSSLRQVSAVFRLPGTEPHDVSATWVAADVGSAAPANYEMATSSERGVHQGRFLYTLPRPLPVGKYRLEVTIDGKPWRSAPFNVIAGLPVPDVASPADLLPADIGHTWTFDFVQQAGEDAKIDMPGVKPDAEGKYRATVTMKVAAEDSNGRHVELRRNDRLVFEEWWRIDAAGLAATKRKQGTEAVMLDPPQLMWRWPPSDASPTWTYVPSDRSYEESFHMWGPVSVRTPDGDRAGFVILAEQRSASVHVTAEREFVPHVGLVHEVDVTAVNDVMVNRQEMSLRLASAPTQSSSAQAAPAPGRAPADEATETADELAGSDEPEPFHMEPNPKLPPSSGRIVVMFPATAQRVEARVEIHDPGVGAAKKTAYGNLSFEAPAAAYDVSVNGIVVHDVPVQAGRDTLLHVGVVHTQVARTTRVNIFVPGAPSSVKFVYGEAYLGFPVGSIEVDTGSGRENVRIEEGKITEF